MATLLMQLPPKAVQPPRELRSRFEPEQEMPPSVRRNKLTPASTRHPPHPILSDRRKNVYRDTIFQRLDAMRHIGRMHNDSPARTTICSVG